MLKKSIHTVGSRIQGTIYLYIYRVGLGNITINHEYRQTSVPQYQYRMYFSSTILSQRQYLSHCAILLHHMMIFFIFASFLGLYFLLQKYHLVRFYQNLIVFKPFSVPISP